MAEEIFICPEGSVGRVDKILASAFPNKSRSLIQRAIEKKMVYRKDGTFLDPKSKVIPGDELIINLVREQSVPLQGVKIPLNILFEDSEILVLDKGAIIERGNHNSLIAMKGRYADMWNIQNEPTDEVEKKEIEISRNESDQFDFM